MADWPPSWDDCDSASGPDPIKGVNILPLLRNNKQDQVSMMSVYMRALVFWDQVLSRALNWRTS